MRLQLLSRCLNALNSVQCFAISTFPSTPIPFTSGHRSKLQYLDSLRQDIHLQPTFLRRHFSTMMTGSDCMGAESSADWKSIPVVKAFAYIPSDLSSNPILGVFWHDNSAHNRLKEHVKRTKLTAEIEAVCLALKQAALKMNLPRIRVITNSKFVCKHFGKTTLWWSLDEFLQQNKMTFSSCSVEAEDLYRLLHMTEVKLEYDPSFDDIVKKFCKNLINSEEFGKGFIVQNGSAAQVSVFTTNMPKYEKGGSEVKLARQSSVANPTNLTASKYQLNKVPVVYTCGVLQSTKEGMQKYAKAGYGIYWPHAEELGTGRRYSFYPTTLIRCQLQAIIEALQQAVDRNYRSIILRTDCVSFLVHHSRQWLKSNGSYVKYHDQYLRIMDLCKSIKVRFQPANDSAFLREAETLAQNGVCLPKPSKKLRKSVAVDVDTTSDVKNPLTENAKRCNL